MKKLLFGMLCVLGGVWGPECKVISLSGDTIISLDAHGELLSYQKLCEAIQAEDPNILFDSKFICNAKLLVGKQELNSDNERDLLACSESTITITLTRIQDMLEIPMARHNSPLKSKDLILRFYFEFAGNPEKRLQIHALLKEKAKFRSIGYECAVYGILLKGISMRSVADDFFYKIVTSLIQIEVKGIVVMIPNHKLLGAPYIPFRQLDNIGRYSWDNDQKKPIITQELLDHGATEDNLVQDGNWSPPGAWIIEPAREG